MPDVDTVKGLMSMDAELRPLPGPLSISATGKLTAIPGAALSPSGPCHPGRLDRNPSTAPGASLPALWSCTRPLIVSLKTI